MEGLAHPRLLGVAQFFIFTDHSGRGFILKILAFLLDADLRLDFVQFYQHFLLVLSCGRAYFLNQAVLAIGKLTS